MGWVHIHLRVLFSVSQHNSLDDKHHKAILSIPNVTVAAMAAAAAAAAAVVVCCT